MPGLAIEQRSATPLAGADTLRSRVHVVRSRNAILGFRDLLVALSVRCEQDEVIDDLQFFLDRPKFREKRACLVLVCQAESEQLPTRVEEILGAVLLYEYQWLGIGSRVFVADYHGAERTVLGPAHMRREVSFRACAELLLRGALIVQLSFLADTLVAGSIESWETPAGPGRARWRWAAKARTTPGYLRLENSLEETLSKLGKHTRRNLRLYRRRAATDLDYEFVSAVQISREKFLELNRLCPYPATDAMAEWRYDAVHRLENGLLIGLQTHDGEWLSLLGGRRHRESMAIEWQMNRPDLPSNSLCTVMRSHLIEHAVEEGMRRLKFVGGTTHTLKHSLINPETVDLVGVQIQLPKLLLKWIAQPVMLEKNFVVQQLSDDELHWRRW